MSGNWRRWHKIALTVPLFDGQANLSNCFQPLVGRKKAVLVPQGPATLAIFIFHLAHYVGAGELHALTEGTWKSATFQFDQRQERGWPKSVKIAEVERVPLACDFPRMIDIPPCRYFPCINETEGAEHESCQHDVDIDELCGAFFIQHAPADEEQARRHQRHPCQCVAPQRGEAKV